MNNIKVKDILEVCDNSRLICGNTEEICNNFSKDTRTLEKGDVYVGIKGEKFDGNLFYREAIEKGAKICILQGVEIPEDEKVRYKDCTIIIVEDTILAIQQIAKYKRSLYNIPVIAITGSVGKTSTKDIVSSVVGEGYKVLKTEGNLNNHIGLPITILRLKEEEALVVEMGMNNLGEIRVLTNIARPNVAIITNVGTSHIGNLGSRENILKAKLEILEGLSEDGVIVINNDNDMLHKWYEENKNKINNKIITYGIKENSDIVARNIELQETGSNFEVNYKDKKLEIKVPVSGEHFVYNSLCAISVASIFNIGEEKIKNGILNFKLTKSRMDIKKFDKYTIINDCYNANYDSMKAAIDYLGTAKDKNKIAILGDMLELGEYSEELHRKVGKIVNQNKIDVLITVGEYSKYINEEATQSNNIHCKDRNEAIKKVQEIIKPNSIILIKASNSMKFEEIANNLIKYISSL